MSKIQNIKTKICLSICVAYVHVTNPSDENSSSSFCGRNVSRQIFQQHTSPSVHKMDADRKAIVLIPQPLYHPLNTENTRNGKINKQFPMLFQYFFCHHYFSDFFLSIARKILYFILGN
jgi:hypothetical protein